MPKIDLVICNPTHIIYPLWNQWLIDNRDKFSKVIICLTDMAIRDPNYGIYLKESLSKYGVIFLDIPRAETGQDWRNKAINQALLVSNGDWVFFNEQDFIIHKPKQFWDLIEEYMELGADAIAYLQGNRAHPCCLFVRRFILENFTRKDFGVIPDKGDHFCMIQEDLEKAENESDLSLYPLTEALAEGWCSHMNGLSQNLHMLQTGITPNYAPEEFKTYCQKCLELAGLHPDYVTLFTNYLV